MPEAAGGSGGLLAGAFCRDVPALVLKVGQYPVQSGQVGVIRSLGRVGVPVFTVGEPGVTPAGVSRYCAGRFVWRATGREGPGKLVAELLAAGRRIGRPAVLVPTDDESAVLVAENREVLSECFLAPGVAPGLPRRLASKAGLHEVCREHGIAAPVSVVPGSAGEAAEFAAAVGFPVVVKNAWVGDRQGRNPVGASLGDSASGTRVVYEREELAGLVGRPGGGPPGVVLQEYIPAGCAEDWAVAVYCDAASDCVLACTGLKVRSWPPQAGVTACGFSVANPDLAALAGEVCKKIGYRGMADLEWCRDLRDGRYKLVDFNPRLGNQFRLFETDAGVDLVRALHLDLTGRVVPAGSQVEGRRLVVEHIDLPARVVGRAGAAAAAARARLGRREQSARPVPVPVPGGPVRGEPWRRVVLPPPVSTELAWLAADDPLPALAVLTRAVSLARIVRRGLAASRRRAAGQRTLARSQASRPKAGR